MPVHDGVTMEKVGGRACLVTVQGIPTVSGRYSNDLSGHMSTTLLKDIE